MPDLIYQGATWRQTVNLASGGNPVDPTDMTAILCPETPITISRLGPGSYEALLTEDETAVLYAGSTHWELWGRTGADLRRIFKRPADVIASCGP